MFVTDKAKLEYVFRHLGLPWRPLSKEEYDGIWFDHPLRGRPSGDQKVFQMDAQMALIGGAIDLWSPDGGSHPMILLAGFDGPGNTYAAVLEGEPEYLDVLQALVDYTHQSFIANGYKP